MANIKLTGQSFKTLREQLGMTKYNFDMCIKSVRPKLDKLAGRKVYYNLTQTQVLLILKHIEGK